MGGRIQPVKGTHDILPEEQGAWAAVRAAAEAILPRYGYREIATPMFERAELFERSVGVATDIVEKEMYTFSDSKGRRIALRPEGTAGVVRACIHHGRLRAHPLDKLYYLGPMFRRERPQKGRYRQFHQLGVEAIGEAAATLDVEVIALLARLLDACGITRVTLELNSVGCPACRPAYREALVAALAPHRAELCPDCQRRLETNPLRLLDCKVPTCGEVTAAAPRLLDHLCEGCRDHQGRVEAGLEALGIPFTVNPRLVRGLDYYTRTAFEAIAEGLGAQAAVAAGGRYDGLVAELGGPPTPAVGFAIGFTPTEIALRELGLPPEADLADLRAAARPRVWCVAITEDDRLPALALAGELRRAGLGPVGLDSRGRSPRAQFQEAARAGARHVVVLGPDERAAGQVVLRDMADRREERVPRDEILGRLAAAGRAPAGE
ncbi:MAG: histidine--tRNA ligase [Nitrospirae bacterium]|nr:MAG: histidine--tRNA ligase [Nitrospirota bacterium]